MSLKGQKTKSEHLEWNRFQLLLNQLERDNEKTFLLLFTFGVYTALRVSDVRCRKWGDVIGKDEVEIKEKKTGKIRKITYHPDLKEIFLRNYEGQDLDAPIFEGNSADGFISIQYINRKIKKLCNKYGIKGRYSSHSWRKTMARHCFEKNGESEKVLLHLSHLLQHSSMQMTAVYLNINDRDVENLYLSL